MQNEAGRGDEVRQLPTSPRRPRLSTGDPEPIQQVSRSLLCGDEAGGNRGRFEMVSSVIDAAGLILANFAGPVAP